MDDSTAFLGAADTAVSHRRASSFLAQGSVLGVPDTAFFLAIKGSRPLFEWIADIARSMAWICQWSRLVCG